MSNAHRQVKRMDGYDVVIAGSGPAGCVLSRELALKGKRVLVLEQGNDSRAGLGSPMAYINGKHAIMNLPKSMYKPTIEGDEVLIGQGLGGGSKLYAGAAFMPDFDMWRNWDIDLEPYLEESMQLSWVSETPDEFIGPGAKRMMEGSAKVGLPFHKATRHVDWDRCKVGCNLASVGCPIGAKWEGAYAAKEAMEHGAEYRFDTKVSDVIIENGTAVGFRAAVGKQNTTLEVRAKAVVSSCGGWGSVPIAKKAGLDKAGSWFTGDPSVVTFGFLPKGQRGNALEHQFAALYHDKDHGCIFGSIGLSPLLTWVMQYSMKEGLRALKDIGRYSRLMTTFSKVHDDDQGWIREDGTMSKTYTAEDKKRLEYSREMNRKLLIASGCDPNDLHELSIILGHPSGTVKVGELLDNHCECIDVPHLYFCDASIFPEAVGMPPVLTLTCLAKYEASYLATVV